MSVIELMLALALASVLLTGALHAGRAVMARLRLHEARLALAQNARFLEKWHAGQRLPGRGASRPHTAWPPLPVAGTRYYRFRFGAVREHRIGRYRLLAEPAYPWLGTRYLMMDQDGRIAECDRDGLGREWCN